MPSIEKMVGPQQVNQTKDVAVVQTLLNRFLGSGCLPDTPALYINGIYNTETKIAIKKFQLLIVGLNSPDGFVTPVGPTIDALNGPLKWAVPPPAPTAPPISNSQYIRWVKGSLNRLLGSTLLDDGTPSEEYRYWVKEFQINQKLNANGEVNESTQNALMKRNRFDGDYVAWIQRSLSRSGEGIVPVTGVWNSETEEVMKDFQTNEGLKADGWVGAKSETALYMRSRIRVPGRLKAARPYKPVLPPPSIWSDSLSAELRMNVWLNGMIIEWSKKGGSTQFLGMMHNLAGPTSLIAHDYLTDSDANRYITAPRGTLHPTDVTSNARDELLVQTKLAQGQVTYAKGWERFKSAVLQIDKQIDVGLFKLGMRTKEDFSGSDPNLRTLVKWVEDMQSKPWSILSHYGPVRGS
ncbi:MAG: peptidoglycan-binding protein [Bryobacteraceae bacterium]